jgi:ribonuclease Z
MVHEATLETAMEEKANGRGHSSTRQAAQLARDAGVGRLIVTHVSSRYDARLRKAAGRVPRAVPGM